MMNSPFSLKAHLFLAFVLILTNVSFAQEEFSFQLYFEDVNGNKDTLVLGFDPNATDSIDNSFGEINLMNQTWDTVFEVRAVKRGFINGASAPLIMSKKNIVLKNENWTGLLIAINKQATGVQLSWDSTVFNDSTVIGSSFKFLECSSPSTYNTILLKDQLGFFNLNNSLFNCSQDDSVNTFTLSFKNKVEYVNIFETNKKDTDFTIYPNPTKDKLTLEIPSEIDLSIPLNFKVIDFLGREVQQYKITNNKTIFNIENYATGFYTGFLLQDNKIIHSKKIIKL